MAKTFAEIAKMFVGLLVTIVAIKRKPVLIFRLEAKYAHTKKKKKKKDCKNEIYVKN